MSSSRKSDKPCRSRGSHADRRHGATRPEGPAEAHTAVAGASAEEIVELCALVVASEEELETYRPWGLVDAEDAPAAALLEAALASLTLRRPTNAEICGGFGGWAQGFAQVAIEHSLSPVDRIGAIAWLARAALRSEERAA